jgi:hypothetical protein
MGRELHEQGSLICELRVSRLTSCSCLNYVCHRQIGLALHSSARLMGLYGNTYSLIDAWRISPSTYCRLRQLLNIEGYISSGHRACACAYACACEWITI